MRRRGARQDDDERVDVELVDAATGEESGLAPALRPDQRRRNVVAGLAVLTLVAAVVGAMNVAEARREAARREALAEIPGVMASLDTPLGELWRLPGIGYPVARTAEVGAFGGLAEGPALQVVDLLSGELRWVHEGVREETCRGVAQTSATSEWPTVELVVCWVASDVVQAEGPQAEEPSRLTVFDLATGAEVGALEVNGGVLGVEVVGEHLLVAVVDAGGAVLVRRWDPRADDVLWAVEGESGLLTEIQASGWVFHVRGDALWIGSPSSPPRSVDTGDPVAALAAPPPDGVLELADGGRAEWRSDPVDGLSTRVLDGVGTLRHEGPGRPWTAPVTDGAPSDVLMIREGNMILGDSGDVVGLDPRTGERLWNAGRLAGMSPCVQLAGIVVAAGSGRAVALDVATGQQLWEGRTDGWAGGLAITDGDVLLLPRLVDGGMTLTAFDIRTGAQGWSVPVPDVDAWFADPVGDEAVLVVWADGTVALLG